MKEVGYNQIALVLQTWDGARFMDKEFESTFGFKAVQKYVSKDGTVERMRRAWVWL